MRFGEQAAMVCYGINYNSYTGNFDLINHSSISLSFGFLSFLSFLKFSDFDYFFCKKIDSIHHKNSD